MAAGLRSKALKDYRAILGLKSVDNVIKIKPKSVPKNASLVAIFD